MSTMFYLVDQYIEQNGLDNREGSTGVKNLEQLLGALDPQYNDSRFDNLRTFLGDNPGAIAAIIEWLQNQNVAHWQENLEEEITPHYDTVEECMNAGIHLHDCDDDGYCTFCGHHQESDDEE